MKIDKLKLRSTIGIILVVIIYIMVLCFEYKTNNKNELDNKQQNINVENSFSDYTKIY